MTVTATRSTPRSSASTARIWSPSTTSPRSSTASMRSPSPSNATPKSSPLLVTSCCKARRSVAPQPTLMFSPSGASPIDGHLRAEVPERVRRDAGVGAVGAVDADVQAVEVAAEAVGDVVAVAADRDLEVVDLAEVGVARRLAEQRLDLLLGLVRELLPVAVEQLDAVVLGRVVRGGDDGAEVEREQRDRRGRQHAREHRVPARRGDAGGERPARARGPTRGCPGRSGPPRRRARRRGPAEPLTTGREIAPDHAANSIRAEVCAFDERGRDVAPDDVLAPRRCRNQRRNLRCVGRLALGPLRGLAGLLQAGLLALDHAGVAGEEALALERHAQLGVGLDERAGDAVPRGAGLSARRRLRGGGCGRRRCPRRPRP